MKRQSWLVASVLVVLATGSFATQVIQRSPEELAKESTLVVNGKVTGVRSYWNEDHSKILTEATVAVDGTHKGRAGSSVRIVQLGGVVDNVRMTAHGALSWQRGEEVLLFLEPSVPGAFQVAGFSQGKYMIERDEQGRAFVRQALPPDAEDAGAPAAPNATATPREQRVTLEQFLARVLPER